MVTVGRRRYQAIVESFRYLTYLLWSSPKLEVLKITKMADNDSIECRWRVNGQIRWSLDKGKDRYGKTVYHSKYILLGIKFSKASTFVKDIILISPSV